MKHGIRLPLDVLVILVGMLALVRPAYAQESSGVTQQPAGVGILLLLMGLGAIALVGFVYVVQTRPPRSDTDEDEEEE